MLSFASFALWVSQAIGAYLAIHVVNGLILLLSTRAVVMRFSRGLHEAPVIGQARAAEIV